MGYICKHNIGVSLTAIFYSEVKKKGQRPIFLANMERSSI